MRYSSAPQSIFEWVYNDADIESAGIVWARSIDAEHDRALLAQFAGRARWVLTVDGTSTDFRPLTE